MTDLENTVQKIDAELKKIDDKDFKVMFFVFDSKGKPNGSLEYIYETAYTLNEMGYNVHMMYSGEEFTGVESWLGEKYASLKHFNLSDNINVSPSDVLFIPEVYVDAMSKTKELPCHRVVIIQNFSYLTDNMPYGVDFSDLRIFDCVVNSKSMGDRVKKCFPYMNVRIVPPCLGEVFTKEKSEKPKDLVINVVGKDTVTISSIVKQFMWKFPNYKWVPFRNVSDIPRDELKDELAKGFATLWCDQFTDFGYLALEAMACNSVVVGKFPESEPDWLSDENGFRDNGLWFFKDGDAQDALAGLVNSFMTESIPDEIYANMEETVSEYTRDKMVDNIKKCYVDGIFSERKAVLETAKNNILNKAKTENKE